ncbi:MAG TPA: FAD-binding protein [Papillibacter sp.]|jgi:succinate dehydrogenase/fumarate reductase flavoprotein subunit|nr:FAD-binding protein [Papillibacter sp.]
MINELNYGSIPPEWPFDVRYGKENRIITDVLVIGAGMAGSMAALMAARRGVRVAVVDKAPIDVSGSGGAGLDHYGGCNSNPDCAVSPEQYMELMKDSPFSVDHRKYISMKGAWDNLMELQRLGLRFRDEDDEFAGAPFRDDKTKIMYAYDYKTKDTIRLRGGANIKKYMRAGLAKEINVSLYERVMITRLLTEGGKSGTRVNGAVGFSEETGEFNVFSAKAVILCTAGVSMQGTGTWTFNSEMFANGFKSDPRNTGDGLAMAWRAGAEMNSEEQFGHALSVSPFGWPWYGIGNADNTWHGCTIVDNNGKEVPWVDGLMSPIDTVEERWLPGKDQAFMGFMRPIPLFDKTLIESGEYELPFWADLSALPEHERRGIWGLMVGNEGRTRIAIYNYYNKAGFNPETDMLQCPVMTPESFTNRRKDWFQGEPNMARAWKADTLRGLAVDWSQQTNVPGLFAAGAEAGQAGATAGAAGAYAGNRAAEFAMEAERIPLDAAQVKAEKTRVYAPVRRVGDRNARIGWKELWMGLNRVMQQDCGEFRTEATLKHGLMWLESIREKEMHLTFARNPHELARVLECENRYIIAEIYLHLGLANIEAERAGVPRSMKLFTKLVDGERYLTFKEDEWWLKPPYAPTYLENYLRYRAKEPKGLEV